MRLRPLALALAVLLLDCAALEPIAPSTCGNGVVDVNEDCDSFPADQCGTRADGLAQCRLRCNAKVTSTDGKERDLVCPEGWGCSVDDFCRAPSGEFELLGSASSPGVTRMVAGDFDGDRRGDILGTNGVTSRARIQYGGTSADPAIVSLPGVFASPVIYDFNADGVSDIAFGYTYRGPRTLARSSFELAGSDGLAVILGQRDRTVVPQAFPFLTIPIPGIDVMVLPLEVPEANLPERTGPVILLVKTAGGSEVLASLPDTAPNAGRFFKPLGGKRVGDPFVGNVLEVADSTCGDIVVALDDGAASRIEIYSPCARRAGKVTFSDAKPLQLPVGAPITAFFVVDLDRDSHRDIIFDTRGSSGVRVLYGNGTGFVEERAPKLLDGVPLAAGLIDRGTRVDFVVPDGILVSIDPRDDAGGRADGGGDDAGTDGGTGLDDLGPITRSTLQWVKVRAPSKKWTVAVIGDVNRDTAPDVVAGSSFEADLDVFEGTLTRDLVSFAVATSGPVTSLGLSDCDFEGTQDIVFVSSRPGTVEREIGISYGRPLTMPPEAPRIAARFDGIRQLFAQPSGIGVSSVVPSLVDGKVSTSLNVSVLFKSTERQPIAPLLFTSPDREPETPTPDIERERVTRALSPTIDRLGPVPVVNLIAIVGASDYDANLGTSSKKTSFGVWAALGTADASFRPPSEQLSLERLPVTEGASPQFLVQMVSGELGAAGGWSTVVVGPDPSDASGATVYVVPPGGPPAMGMGGGNVVRGIEILPPPLRIAGRQAYPDSRLQLLDLDGDGKLDVVTLLRETAAQTPSLVVLFGEGMGVFGATPLVISLPLPERGVARDVAPVDFAQVTTRGASARTKAAKRRELAVVTASQLYRVAVANDRSVTVENATKAFGKIRGATAIVAVDADGDGVTDLAVADDGIRIARQRSQVNP